MKNKIKKINNNLLNSFVVTNIPGSIKYKEEIEKRTILRNLDATITLAVVCFIITLLLVVSDIVSKLYIRCWPITIMNMTTEVLHISCSLIFVIWSIKKDNIKNIKKAQLMTRIYYFIMCLGFSLYSLSDSMRGVISNTSYFVLIVLIAIPIFNSKGFICLYMLYYIPTFIYECITSNLDFLNLIIFVVGLLLSSFMRVNYVKNTILQIKFEESSEKLKKMSYTDNLTDLGNRRQLYKTYNEKIETWVNDNKEICYIMSDVDNFKNFNDSYTHFDGDECLKKISKAIKKSLDQFSNIEYEAIRYGGEEFLMMIVGDNLDDIILNIFKTLKNNIANLNLKSGKDALYSYVSLSFGAFIKKCSINSVIDQDIKCADKQLYNAKESYKNCLSYKNILYK